MRRFLSYISPNWFVKPPAEGNESFIQSLKARLAFPRLTGTKIILESILSTLTPHRGYEDMTSALAQRTINVAIQVSALLETVNDMSQMTEDIGHFECILRDVHFFVQLATQSSILDRLLFEENMWEQCITLEQQLRIFLVHFEEHILAIRDADSILPAQSQIASLSSIQSVDMFRSGGIFSKAHDLVVTGGNYYSGQIFIQQPSNQESGQITTGIIQGVRVVAFEDISIVREIYTNRGYRLHSAKVSGRVVKVYHGPRAKERCQEAANFNKKVMHPSLLHMIAVSSFNSQVPFLVCDGELEGSAEASISMALKDDLTKSLILGLQTVIGLSSALSYLQHVDYPFIYSELEDFTVLLTIEGNVIISFDPYIVHGESEGNSHKDLASSSEGNLQFIFHGLCEQTFEAACEAHYKRERLLTLGGRCAYEGYKLFQGQKKERAYTDMLEDEEALGENLFEDVIEVNNNSGLKNDKPSYSSNNGRSRRNTKSRKRAKKKKKAEKEKEKEKEKKVSSQDVAPASKSGLSWMPQAASSVFSTQAHKESSIDGHRRELVWKSENEQKFSLDDINNAFKTVLNGVLASSSPILHHRRGRYTAGTAHRCPGYTRTEITLTANIMRSAIVSHSTPLPHEICPVCEQVVKDAEIFNCVCQGEDNESVPTIQCSSCCEWHHRPCVVGPFEDHIRRFTCSFCGLLSKTVTKRIAEDSKEFFGIRNLEEAEVYFSKLRTQYHHRLVDKLVSYAIESKETDARLVSDFFRVAAQKNLCSPVAFEEGFMPTAQIIDDIAIDAPKAFVFFALMIRGAQLDQDRRMRLASKTMDSDKFLALLQ